jgi:hypothetical protein
MFGWLDAGPNYLPIHSDTIVYMRLEPNLIPVLWHRTNERIFFNLSLKIYSHEESNLGFL